MKQMFYTSKIIKNKSCQKSHVKLIFRNWNQHKNIAQEYYPGNDVILQYENYVAERTLLINSETPWKCKHRCKANI